MKTMKIRKIAARFQTGQTYTHTHTHSFPSRGMQRRRKCYGEICRIDISLIVMNSDYRQNQRRRF